jgi:hypothetical protein
VLARSLKLDLQLCYRQLNDLERLSVYTVNMLYCKSAGGSKVSRRGPISTTIDSSVPFSLAKNVLKKFNFRNFTTSKIPKQPEKFKKSDHVNFCPWHIENKDQSLSYSSCIPPTFAALAVSARIHVCYRVQVTIVSR